MAEYNLTPVSVPPVQTRWRTIQTALPVPESLPHFEELRRSEPRSMSGQMTLCSWICRRPGAFSANSQAASWAGARLDHTADHRTCARPPARGPWSSCSAQRASSRSAQTILSSSIGRKLARSVSRLRALSPEPGHLRSAITLTRGSRWAMG